MTDISPFESFLPSRLDCTFRRDEGGPVGELHPYPETCHRGVIRSSAVVFLVDAIAGLITDAGSETWTFTSDLSLRVPATAAPERIDARCAILRAGRRSVTCSVELTAPDGEPWGWSLVGFVLVPRREGDPPKPLLDMEDVLDWWEQVPRLTSPMRDAVGVRQVSPEKGVVEVDLRPELLNPSGALQGAMVTLVAESGAEDLAGHHLGAPHVVTDLDVRFVGQGRVGPVRSAAAFIGPPSDGSIRVELVDTGQDGKIVTTVLARVRPVP